MSIGMKFLWRTPKHKLHRLTPKRSKSVTHAWSADYTVEWSISEKESRPEVFPYGLRKNI